MRKQFLTLFYVASLGASALICHAQPYSNAVTALNPIAYWPLNETAAPPATVPAATNLGSLGAAYDATFSGDVSFGLPGAVAGDTADGFLGTGYAQTPYGSAIANAPSFTVEAWILAHNVSSGATECALSDFSGTRSGWLLYLNVNNPGQYNFRTYDGVDTSASVSLNLGAAGSITQDSWHYVVVVVSNAITATNVYGYIDGVAVGNAAEGGLGYKPNDGATGGFSIGQRTDGGFRFNGDIDEVAYYTSALDATTIAAHYTAATTAPATYAAVVEAGSPSLYFRMDEPNNLPVAHNYGSLGSAVNGYYESGTVPGVPGPNFAPFGNGFGSGDFACQFSPSGTENNTNPGPGVVCGTSDLSALDDQGSLTVSAWVKVPPGAVGWFTGVLGRGDSSYRMAVDQSGAPHFADGGGGNGDIVGSGAVNDGLWHQWVGVYDSVSSNAYLYIDSLEVGSAVWNPPGGNPDMEFYIGGAPDYDGRNFVGDIAQVAVFNKVLTPAQVGQVYYSTAPSPFALAVSALKPAAYWPLSETTQPPSALTTVAANSGSAGSSSDATINGDLIFGAPGALAGTSDSADVFSSAITWAQAPYSPTISTEPPFTVEAWLSSYNPGGGTACPVSDIDANSPRSGWLLYMDLSTPGLYTFRTYNTNATTPSLSMDLGAAGSISANKWYHVVVVVSNAPSGLTAYGYINGALVAGPTAIPSYVPNDGAGGGFSMGARSDGGFHFIGGIDEVAYYASALDANTIEAHYQAGTNTAPATSYSTLVSQKSPILYYRLDEAPVYSPYPETLPIAANYGTTGSNATGYYQPGAIPGVPGPTNVGFGPNSLACNFNPSIVPSTTTAGPGVLCDPYDFNALNPTNGFTMTAWVLATNAYFETVIGRSDNSYRFDIDGTGFPHFAAAPNSDLIGADDAGDGLWHYWEGVYDPSTQLGTLYIDGVAVASAAWQPPAPLEEYLLLGGAPDYTGRNFSGSLSHVAIFTNALTVAQLASLYGSIGVRPTINLPTNALYINQGANGSITASIGGTAPFSDQWYYIDTSSVTHLVSGQTTPTLSITDAEPAEDGWQYFLVVGNEYGATTSSIVTLTVVQGPPTIQADITPPLTYAPVGVQDGFNLVATGSQPFSYHWYLNGSSTPIAGATNSTYNFTVLAGSNLYSAQVSNAFGPAVSSTVAVVGLVGAPPVISFASAASDWTTNNPNAGQQVPEISSNLLVLTDNTNGEVTSAFYNTPQYIGGFVAKFTFLALPGNASMADGSSFSIENSAGGPTAVGGGGGDLGVYSLHDIASFLVDLYNIAAGGIQFSTNGETGGGTAPAFSYIGTSPFQIEIADPINVRLFFNEGTMYVLMTDPKTGAVFQDSHYFGDIVSIVGGASAYVGFTGSTGGVASQQEYSNFEFSSTTPPILSVATGTDSSIVISWPVSVSTLFTLQQSGSVVGPWQNLGGSTVVSGQNQVTVANSAGPKFYRLVLQ